MGARAAGAAGRRRTTGRLSPRLVLAKHGHVEGFALAGEALAEQAGALEGMGMTVGGWSERRVLVTGATGMVGSWLIKDLLSREAHVVALVRDPDPQTELWRSGDWRRISIVQGKLEDFWTLERAISEHATDTVFHLAAQPIVG